MKWQRTLIVEGWRFPPHSYAVVNQWQLLALKRRGDVEIKFIDVPYYNPKWQRQGGLFDRVDEDLLKFIPIARPGECADVSFRITFPYDSRNFLDPNCRVWHIGISGYYSRDDC